MSIGDMARRKTIDEVFAPAQQQFRESDMSEEELDQLVDAARHDQTTKVALLFAGGDQGGSNGQGITYGNPIQKVLDAFKVDLLYL